LYEIDECMNHYKKLMSLLEEDSSEIARGFQGDLLNAYCETVQREKNVLSEQMQSIYLIQR